MTFKFIYLIIALLLVAGCNTGPDFERRNENDPEGFNFKPNPPSEENYYFENNNIIIVWKDNTGYEDGYLIERSTFSVDDFKVIDTLSSNSTQYADSLNNLGFPTFYKIAALSNNEKGEHHSDSIFVEIDFGEVQSFKSELVDNKVLLTWNDNIVNHSGYLLSRFTDIDSVSKVIATIDNSENSYSVHKPDDGFVSFFDLKPFVKNDNNTGYLKSAVNTINVNGPTNFKAQFLTPDSLFLTWNDNSDFEDGFEIKNLDDNKLIERVPVNATELILNVDFSLRDSLKYELYATLEDFRSPKQQCQLEALVPSPSIDTVHTLNSGQIKLFINDSSGVRRSYDIFRKSGNDSFQFVGKIPKGKSEYIDQGLNKSEVYTYQVKTELSEPSEPYVIYYEYHPKHLKRVSGPFVFSGSDNFDKAISPAIDFFALRTYSSQLNGNMVSKLNFNSLEIENMFQHSEEFQRIRLSHDGQVLALKEYRSSTIFIYNFNTGEELNRISLPENYQLYDFLFLSDSNYLLTSSRDSGPVYKINIQENSYEQIAHDFEDSNAIQMKINNNLDEVVFININPSMPGRQIFSIQGDSLINQKEFKSITHTIGEQYSFSPSYDTLVVGNTHTITAVDVSDNFIIDQITSFSGGLSYPETTYIKEGNFFAAPSQYSNIIYNLNTIDEDLRIVYFDKDVNGFTSGGVHYSIKNNLIFEFRRSHVSGIQNYIDIYQPNKIWKKVVIL